MPDPIVPAVTPEIVEPAVVVPVVADAEDDITPPDSTAWWKFATKEEAQVWGNKLVTGRLARDRKTNLDPVVQERDTLKAEVDRLKPLELASLTDAQRRDAEFAALTAQNTELQSFKAERTRTDLVSGIATELGLSPKLVPHVVGNDEDSIRANVTSLLDALSESGSTPPPKSPPKPKSPKEIKPVGDSLESGGGGAEDEDITAENILAALDKKRNSFSLR